MKKRYIFGAGGHAKVLLDIASLLEVKIDGLFDDDENLWDKSFYSSVVLGGKVQLPESETSIVAIGDNDIRQKLVSYLCEKKYSFLSLMHPQAVISSSASLSSGTVAMAGVVVNADSKIGEHCIINTRSSIDHDCVIDNFVHVAPGAVLCGGVTVGELSLIGAGATILPGVKVGKSCTVGAGAVVLNDLPDNSKVWGNPAKLRSETHE